MSLKLSQIDPEWEHYKRLTGYLTCRFGDHLHWQRCIHSYYLPLFYLILGQVRELPQSDLPLFVGISGPQGCGKSQLTGTFVDLFSEVGLKAVTLSIDDFYLTRSEQVELARRHSTNKLLQQRGYPGTHDIALGVQTLDALKHINVTGSVELPVYDKSKNSGLGDRLPRAEWKKVEAPVDVVFLEGWMLGFAEAPANKLPACNQDLADINALLSHYQSWHRYLNLFVHLIPLELSYVIPWRIQAEEKMRAEGKAGMSEADISAYVKKFIPAYELYVPLLMQSPPVPDNTLQVTLGVDRLPI